MLAEQRKNKEKKRLPVSKRWSFFNRGNRMEENKILEQIKKYLNYYEENL